MRCAEEELSVFTENETLSPAFDRVKDSAADENALPDESSFTEKFISPLISFAETLPFPVTSERKSTTEANAIVAADSTQINAMTGNDNNFLIPSEFFRTFVFRLNK